MPNSLLLSAGKVSVRTLVRMCLRDGTAGCKLNHSGKLVGPECRVSRAYRCRPRYISRLFIKTSKRCRRAGYGPSVNIIIALTVANDSWKLIATNAYGPRAKYDIEVAPAESAGAVNRGIYLSISLELPLIRVSFEMRRDEPAFRRLNVTGRGCARCRARSHACIVARS